MPSPRLRINSIAYTNHQMEKCTETDFLALPYEVRLMIHEAVIPEVILFDFV